VHGDAEAVGQAGRERHAVPATVRRLDDRAGEVDDARGCDADTDDGAGRRSEELAADPELLAVTSEFDLLVAEAIDRLPGDFQRLLDTTPVVVSQLGAEHRAYGHYFGDTVARDDYPDRIVVYQDTLERDFGHDPDLLRAQVERTLRHELAHHLGWHERGVRDLGL